ncbi:MAG TPA: energy transducer TonB [Chitinivibrionales bacterium]|nr:energy transducer TonB [Chitinivibrionales bacterium]
MHILSYWLLWIGRLALAVVVSFLLFTGVSLLHAAVGLGSKSDKQQALRISATDIVRKPPEEKKLVQQRIRQVQTPTNQGRSLENQMTMRFAPDLDVDNSGEGAGVALQKQELSAEVFEQGQVDQDASPDYTPPIPYPNRAAEQGIKGTVEVEFVVTHEGKITDVQVTKSSSSLFTEAVKRGVAQWRFKPAKNKGIPVNQRFRQVIHFNLDQ